MWIENTDFTVFFILHYLRTSAPPRTEKSRILVCVLKHIQKRDIFFSDLQDADHFRLGVSYGPLAGSAIERLRFFCAAGLLVKVFWVFGSAGGISGPLASWASERPRFFWTALWKGKR